MIRSRLTRTVVSLAATVALASCSHASAPRASQKSSVTTAPRIMFVAIGSTFTFGRVGYPLTETWPQKLFVSAFPQSTVMVNAANRDVTVQRALGQQLSLALEVHATVVAIWLGDSDLREHRPASQFESDLDLLVQKLRVSGARVLLGNMSRSRPGAAAYDDAIALVARTRGATLVDLATALAPEPTVGPDSIAEVSSSATIARSFALALARP